MDEHAVTAPATAAVAQFFDLHAPKAFAPDERVRKKANPTGLEGADG